MNWLLVLFALLQASRLSSACHKPTPKTSLSLGGSHNPDAWSPKCAASVKADFSHRDRIPEYKDDDCWGSSTWGPRPHAYSTPEVSSRCYRTKWAHKRVLAVIDKNTKRGLNYCHHHVPSWLPPKSHRRKGTCSSAGTNDDGDIIWKGFDCSHFTSWVYNYGFGMYLTTGIAAQACGPSAPGRLLPVSKSSKNLGEVLRPGDLLFIADSASDDTFDITHVVMWTGIELTYDHGPFSFHTLFQNLHDYEKHSVKTHVEKAREAGKKVYVIADSHYAGPAYRIFAGWWADAFSHARRIISPDSDLPRTSRILKYDDDEETCVNVRPGVSPVPDDDD